MSHLTRAIAGGIAMEVEEVTSDWANGELSQAEWIAEMDRLEADLERMCPAEWRARMRRRAAAEKLLGP